MSDNAREAVLEFFNCRGGIPGGTEDEKLACRYLDVGLLDSLGLVDMILEIEEKCGFRFEAEQMQSPEFRTIGGVIEISQNLVWEHTNA